MVPQINKTLQQHEHFWSPVSSRVQTYSKHILPHIRKEKVTQNRRHFKHSTAHFIHRAQLITAIKPERASFNMIMDYYGDTERTRHSQGWMISLQHSESYHSQGYTCFYKDVCWGRRYNAWRLVLNAPPSSNCFLNYCLHSQGLLSFYLSWIIFMAH